MEIDYKTLKNFADDVAIKFTKIRYKLPLEDIFKVADMINKIEEDDINE